MRIAFTLFAFTLLRPVAAGAQSVNGPRLGISQPSPREFMMWHAPGRHFIADTDTSWSARATVHHAGWPGLLSGFFVGAGLTYTFTHDYRAIAIDGLLFGIIGFVISSH
jgi:hypothetical protein